jgi:hypothetical protein
MMSSKVSYRKSRGNMLSRKAVVSTVLVAVLILAVILGGCQSGSAALLIQGKVAQKLGTMAKDAINGWDREIARIDGELMQAKTKLGKLNQLAGPALKWVDYIKAQAQQEQWNGRIVAVTSDLNKFKNDQFSVAKLELKVEMLTAGMRYTSTIHIDDLKTGQVTPCEELLNTLQNQVTTLTQQREARAKTRNTARSTAITVFDLYPKWKVQKVNSITYNVSGQGLGMETAITMGTWTYSTDTEQLDPSGAAATNLRKVLTGK